MMPPPKQKGEKMKKAQKAQVVINTNHQLLPEQERLLNQFFPYGWERLDIPAEGLSLGQQVALCAKFNGEDVVFASPVPFLLARLAYASGAWDATAATASNHMADEVYIGRVYVFHNDQRVAKEVPDGHGGVKVIHTVAPEGWTLAKASMLVN
jgi:hypothetical protein